MQTRIFSLLFLVAGVLLFQSAQAQTSPPVIDANGTHEMVPPGTVNAQGDFISVFLARNGGTITGTGGRTSNVSALPPDFIGNNRALYATGPNSLISMTIVNIAVTNSTVDSGVGATQHTLLDVTQTVDVAEKDPVSLTAAVTQAENHPSVVDLTASFA